MGCFNVTGTISGMTIGYNDRVAFIPLIPIGGRYNRLSNIRNNDALYGTSWLHDVTSVFEPLTMPIFGTYDDYGCIENIVRTTYTDKIESMFDCTIDDFCDIFSRQDDSNAELRQRINAHLVNKFGEEAKLEICSGMWEHEHIITTLIDAYDMSLNQYEVTPKFAVPKAFFSLQGIVNETIDIIDSIDLKTAYASVSAGNNTPVLVNRMRLASIDDLKDTVAELGILAGGNRLYDIADEYEWKLMSKALMHDMIPHTVTMDTLYEYARYISLGCAMRSVNAMFMPMLTGEQHGNTTMERVLIDAMDSVLKTRTADDDE